MIIDTYRLGKRGKVTHLRSKEYNYSFNHQNGLFARWGKTFADDPEFSPYGPEILDIEVSTKCSRGCKFCYKDNTVNGSSMPSTTFNDILHVIPGTVRQIALGIGDINADEIGLAKILALCDVNDIVPNITINGRNMRDGHYAMLAKNCGAVAVSRYDADECYSTVEGLTAHGMKQVNIHSMLSEETYDDCLQTIRDAAHDRRLEDLNAVVFLWLKPKGRGVGFRQLQSMQKFKELINLAFDNKINIGFDSCSSANFLRAVRDHADYKRFEMMVEPCESCCFSYYINVNGIGFPCSFTEGNPAYKGTNVLECDDFLKGVWFGEEAVRFRAGVLANKDANGCRMCPIYNLELKDDQ